MRDIQQRRRAMVRTLCTCIFVLLLASCGGGERATDTPEAIHTRWVQALRTQQRKVALDLAAGQPLKEAFVATSLATMRAKQDPTATGGALENIEVRAPLAAGDRMSGISVWHFAQRTECWRTTLVAEDGRWQVSDWAQTTPCP